MFNESWINVVLRGKTRYDYFSISYLVTSPVFFWSQKKRNIQKYLETNFSLFYILEFCPLELVENIHQNVNTQFILIDINVDRLESQMLLPG